MITVDVWAEELSTASYGGVELDVIATTDTIARSLVQHTYARKDGADIVDFGAEPRVTECRVIFFERALEGDDSHLVRYAAFCDAVARGVAQTFVHPITGRYQALVENFVADASADSPNSIEVSCTFVEDTTRPEWFDGGNGRAIASGAAAVAAEGALLDAAMLEAGIEDPIGSDLAALVAAWEGAGVTVREVNAQVGAMADRIDAALDAYDLATDPSKYFLYRSIQRLNYSARRAAARKSESQTVNYELTLTVAKPLRVLVAENYGADDVERLCASIRDLNDIDDPTLLPAGTTIRVPARTSYQRDGRR